MEHDFSLESEITEGNVQLIERVSTDFNNIEIIFRNINTNKITTVRIIGFNNLQIYLDNEDDIVIDNANSTVQSLIGFSLSKIENKIKYCIKTDFYEMSFYSINMPDILK